VDIALDDPASFAAGHPHDQYAWLRRQHPVWFHPEKEGQGFWAVTSYADVVTVSRNPETYSSWLGGVMLPDAAPELLAGSRLMMLYQDPPEHTRYRRLVSRSFTPRAVASWRERIDRLATEIIDRVISRGECDLVVDVAGEMPSLVVAELMGIPAEDGRRL
jgi:cholest-4-en-3-one 26-monooxygenase